MKTFLLVAAAALMALGSISVSVSAQSMVSASTEGGVAVSSSTGVVDVYEPGLRFIVRESTGPVSYSHSPQAVYATLGGMVLTAEQVRAHMRAGLPVRVEYVPQGETRVIQRVIIHEHDDD